MEKSRSMRVGILSTIGNTPTIRLEKLFAGADLEVFAKVEALNPGGSIKDRPALRILEMALQTGQVQPGGVVVESSSGNMGIGLAQVCRYFGLHFICVVDPKTAPLNLRVLQAYGAQIEMVLEADPVTKELLPARLARVQELLREHPGAFWPNQYANPNNSSAHYRTTMREVVEQVGRPVDFLFAATSTCGTIRGCGDYIEDHGLSTRLVAVDARGSLIFSDIQAPRMIPGLGAGVKPPLCDPSLLHAVVHVTDQDCVSGCRYLLHHEAILAGGSSGGVVAGFARFMTKIPRGSVCVLLLCDRGERYLDTIYDDAWVLEHCGGGPLQDFDSQSGEALRYRWVAASF